MLDLAKRSSTMLIIGGIVSVIFGVMAMAWPVSTALALVMLWGFFALADGVWSIISAFREGASGGLRLFLLLVGALGIMAGFIAITRPVASAVTLTWLIGIWLFARGIMEIISGFSFSGSSRWWLILGGVLWLVAGGLLAANPGEGALTIALWIGITAVAWGITSIVAGFTVKREIAA